MRGPVIIDFNVQELTIIIFEAIFQLKRTEGATIEDACAKLTDDAPACYADMNRAAHAVLAHIGNRMQAAGAQVIEAEGRVQ